MAFNHVALATRDLRATHHFYSEVIGFDLVYVDRQDLPSGGWFLHVFYDTGEGELLAFFDLHGEEFDGRRDGISTGLGLPGWVNHIAFTAHSAEEIERRTAELRAAGLSPRSIDHGIALSLYVEDPDGNTIEFCHPTGNVLTD